MDATAGQKPPTNESINLGLAVLLASQQQVVSLVNLVLFFGPSDLVKIGRFSQINTTNRLSDKICT